MQPSLPILRYVIAGEITRDFIISPSGKTYLDIPGGSLLYSAGGFGIWDDNAGLLGRVGEDYPLEWLEPLSNKSFDSRGIVVLPEEFDQRVFRAYSEEYKKLSNNPVKHFSKLGLHFPKALLGYNSLDQRIENGYDLQKSRIRITDVPDDYLDTTAVHICPLDINCQNQLSLKFKQGHINSIMLDTARYYMNPNYFDQIPALVHEITTLFTTTNKALNLFQGRSKDIKEIAKTLANYGCEFVVIKAEEEGQLLYDRNADKFWHIPAYPVNIVDPTGAGDAFCGGYLAGYRLTYDPLQAVLYGNISASLAMEGSSPFYSWKALPGLAKARLDYLRGQISEI